MLESRFSLLSLLSLAVLAAGCGQQPSSPANAAMLTSNAAAYGVAATPNDPTQTGHGPRRGAARRAGEGGREAFGFPLVGLQLSAEQHAKLQAIAATYRAQGQPAAGHADALQAILTAPSVDDAALRAHFAAAEAKRAEGLARRVAMLGELRAVLTDAQRAQLAAAPTPAPRASEAPAGRPHGPAGHDRRGHGGAFGLNAKALAGLTLTADQQSALAALKAKLAPGHPAAGVAQARRLAFVAFIQSGDQAALLAALKAQPAPAAPVDEFAKFVEALDPTQRQALFAKHRGPFQGGRGHAHQRPAPAPSSAG